MEGTTELAARINVQIDTEAKPAKFLSKGLLPIEKSPEV
jgi:hypothetical protein